jgi:hypothetical protein
MRDASSVAIMPAPDVLHGSLASLAQRAVALGVAWHAILAVALLALLLGWRPSQRLAGLLLAVPLASTGMAAWWGDNPFNALVLGAGAAVLALGSLRLAQGPVEKASSGTAPWALALVAFGWMYPHFATGSSPLSPFFASPLGVLPCPTLACVIGLTILARGFRARAWPTALAALGLFYGLFGTLALGVFMDTFLTIGALMLLGVTWSHASFPARRMRHS